MKECTDQLSMAWLAYACWRVLLTQCLHLPDAILFEMLELCNEDQLPDHVALASLRSKLPAPNHQLSRSVVRIRIIEEAARATNLIRILIFKQLE